MQNHQKMKGLRFIHVYEVRPRKDDRGFDLISGAEPFGRLWYCAPNAVANAIDYAKFFSHSQDVSDESAREVQPVH